MPPEGRRLKKLNPYRIRLKERRDPRPQLRAELTAKFLRDLSADYKEWGPAR
jgi:hypothetical protein